MSGAECKASINGGGDSHGRRVSFDEKGPLLGKAGAAGSKDDTKNIGGTFQPVHPTRKPSVSIIDSYNSPVRRAGTRGTSISSAKDLEEVSRAESGRSSSRSSG